MGRFYRVRPQGGVSAAALDQLKLIPGVILPDARPIVSIGVPSNAIGVVHRILGGPTAHLVEKPAFEFHLARPELNPGVESILTPYQLEGARRATVAGDYHLIYSAGAGKTAAAILWAIQAPGTILFVTKASARLSMKEEFEKWTTIRPVIFEGRQANPDQKVFGHRAIIIGWETLPDWLTILKFIRPTSIVFDEIHKSRSHRRFAKVIDPKDEDNLKFSPLENISYAAMIVSRLAARRLGTTATPIADRVRDLWAQLDLVEPRQWGKYWDWSKRYAGAFETDYGWDDRGSSNLNELIERYDAVRHRVPISVSHGQLPAKRRSTIYLRPQDQNRPTGGFVKELRSLAKDGASLASQFEMRLMEAASRKRKRVVEMVMDEVLSAGKVVVFTGRHSDCEALGEEVKRKIEDALAKRQLQLMPPFWVAHGGTSIDERDEIRKAYMASPGPAVIIGTGEAWGESLNLNDTDLALFVMLPYTPRSLHQWEGRFSRLGQKRPVRIVSIVAEQTVDEHVASILLKKLPAVEKLVQDEMLMGAEKDLRGNEEELMQSLIEKMKAMDEKEVSA